MCTDYYIRRIYDIFMEIYSAFFFTKVLRSIIFFKKMAQQKLKPIYKQYLNGATLKMISYISYLHICIYDTTIYINVQTESNYLLVHTSHTHIHSYFTYKTRYHDILQISSTYLSIHYVHYYLNH